MRAPAALIARSALPALLDACPDFFVEVVCNRVAGWLDDGQGAADQCAAGQQGADAESDGEMDKRKAQGLAHGCFSGRLVFDRELCGQS